MAEHDTPLINSARRGRTADVAALLAGGADVAFFVCAYIGAAKFNLFRKLAVRK